MVKHQETHPHLDVDDCFGCRIASVSFTGMERMKREREGNTTQAELRKEIYEGARMRGKDIRRAGVTSPTSGGL